MFQFLQLNTQTSLYKQLVSHNLERNKEGLLLILDTYVKQNREIQNILSISDILLQYCMFKLSNNNTTLI